MEFAASRPNRPPHRSDRGCIDGSCKSPNSVRRSRCNRRSVRRRSTRPSRAGGEIFRQRSPRLDAPGTGGRAGGRRQYPDRCLANHVFLRAVVDPQASEERLRRRFAVESEDGRLMPFDRRLHATDIEGARRQVPIHTEMPLDKIGESDPQRVQRTPLAWGEEPRRQADGVDRRSELIAWAGIVGTDRRRTCAGRGSADHESEIGAQQIL